MSWREVAAYLEEAEGAARPANPIGLKPRGAESELQSEVRGARPAVPIGQRGRPLAPAGLQQSRGLSATPLETPWGRGWGAAMSAAGSQASASLLSERGMGSTGGSFDPMMNDPVYRMAMKNAGLLKEPLDLAAPVTHGGGAWAVMDQWDVAYNKASVTTGVPANVIKAFQAKETGRADYTGQENCTVRSESGCLALNSGIFEATAMSYGLSYERIRDDPNYAIQAIGVILADLAMSDAAYWGGAEGKTLLEDGGWEGVSRVYFGGQQAYVDPNWRDEMGTSAADYQADITMYVNQLDGREDEPPSKNPTQVISSPNNPAGNQVINPDGQAIANLADNYVNVEYVWGAIPAQGQDPYETGWDCSGFVSYIMDTLGYAANDVPGGVPNGSHWQAQWAMSNGRWRSDIDYRRMQPGDLVFFDTGADGGGGQGEVSQAASRATHVGIYLGDGKVINAMKPCGPGLTMGVNCGTGIVSLNDNYWGQTIIGYASMDGALAEAATGAAGTGSVR